MKTTVKPKSHGEGTVDQLEPMLDAGNFRGAVEAFKRLEPTVAASLRQLDRLDPRRVRAATAAAELYFYQGRYSEAEGVLGEYVDDDRFLVLDGIAARAKLQVAELHYTHRDFAKAHETAKKILSQYDRPGHQDILGAAEAAYYLARASRRSPETVGRYCHLAIDRLARAGMANPTLSDEALAWRYGRVLVLAATAHLRAGHLEKATSKGHLAHWLLKRGADFISIANVEQLLGVILRSQGGDYEESLRLLNGAHAAYKEANHLLHIARVLTDIARAHLDMRDWKRAHDNLNAALEACDQVTSPELASRQRAEVSLFLAWLCQRRTDVDLATTERYAKAQPEAEKALALAQRFNSKRLIVDSRITLGYCRLGQDDYVGARKHFDEALAQASELRVPKLQVNAYLSLAELCSAPPVKDVRSALDYYRRADQLMRANASAPEARLPVADLGDGGTSARLSENASGFGGATAHFLVEKQNRILRYLEELRGEFFIVTPEEMKKQGLKAARQRLQEWALEWAQRQGNGRVDAMAELLGMSRPSVYIYKKQGDAVRK